MNYSSLPYDGILDHPNDTAPSRPGVQTSDHALHVVVIAVKKLRAGEPINPKSLTRTLLGHYAPLIREWHEALLTYEHSSETPEAVLSIMADYWTAVRAKPEYAALVAAVDQDDIEDAAAEGSGERHRSANGLHGQAPGATNGTGDDQPEGPRPLVVTMSDVEAAAIEWLWWPYIAIGKLAMLDGDPGIGKSLLMTQLAGSLSRDYRLPDQDGKPTLETGGPQTTLLLCTEDGLADTIKPRLDAAGADCTRIHVLTGWLGAEDEFHVFTLQHIEILEAALQRYQPQLVVIDPIQAYLGNIDMHRANETRPLLAALTRLAEQYRCAIVCIRHPSKPGQGQGKVIHRGLGSIDFIGAARTGLFVEQHPTHAGKVLLGQSKSNIGMLGRTQVFTKDRGEFAWAGVSRLSAELVGGSGRGPEPYAFLEAVCWLEDRLKPEIPEKSETLEQEASAEGISHKILMKAKKALGIRSIQANGYWLCTLPALPVITPPPITTHPTGDTGDTGATGATGDSGLQSSTYDTAGAESPIVPVYPEDPEYPVSPIVTGALMGAGVSSHESQKRTCPECGATFLPGPMVQANPRCSVCTSKA